MLKEVVVVWTAIALAIVSLLFVPYGYTKITSHDLRTEIPIVVPWTYVGHRFILSEPPRGDPRLLKSVKLSPTHFETIDDMRIAWHIVAIQVAIIVLLAIGAIFSLRKRRQGNYR